MRIPEHIGIIPDGNRRWADRHGFDRECGYKYGLKPGLRVYKICRELGVRELSYYGFTMDNTKRPRQQARAFTRACIQAVEMLSREDACLQVIGNTSTPMFPEELLPYTRRQTFGRGGIKINFLVNYGWKWDLASLAQKSPSKQHEVSKYLKSRDVSRIDLIIRWGGRRRLSGFLPVQSTYADFYIIEDLWPDFRPAHLQAALAWYDRQDITLGG